MKRIRISLMIPLRDHIDYIVDYALSETRVRYATMKLRDQRLGPQFLAIEASHATT